MIIDYLKKTHTYYIETQVPLIEKLIKGLFKSHSFDMRSLKLIRKFFWEYKKELLEHLSREEKTTFPYVRDVYRVFHSVHSTKKEKET